MFHFNICNGNDHMPSKRGNQNSPDTMDPIARMDGYSVAWIFFHHAKCACNTVDERNPAPVDR